MASQKRVYLCAGVLLSWFVLAPLVGAAASGIPNDSIVTSRYREVRRPILFEENRGQAFAQTGFLARVPGFVMLLTPDETVWVSTAGPQPAGNSSGSPRFDPVQIHMEYVDRQPDARLVAEELLPARTTYLGSGTDGRSRSFVVENHRRVRYEDIYPGIDLVFHGDRSQLEFDFILAPGADPDRIRLRFKETDSISIGADGELIVASGPAEVHQLPPRIFQRIDGRQIALTGHYRLHDDRSVSIELDASYDPNEKLIIDPVLGFSSYHGGSADDVPGAIAVDSDGNLYVAGSTGSTDFPLRNPIQAELAGDGTPNKDVFVTKLDPTGSTVLYSTYIGGEGTDIARSIAVDSLGRAVVTGTTFSSDFPATTGAYQPTCSGQCPFVVMLSTDGSQFVYSTFVGRGDGEAVAVDSQNRPVVTGRTSSADFPVMSAFQEEGAGGWDAFVFKLNADGSQLEFSTYLGGTGDENLSGRRDLAVDSSDNIYVVGRTTSDDFPTLQSIQSGPQGEDDAFVAKFGGQGSLLYATYLGGSLDDGAQGIVADAAGSAYVTGVTLSGDFPTAGALQPIFGGSTAIGDAFLAKIAPGGGELVFSTYLGGTGGDTGVDVVVDDLGRPVVVGSASTSFPTRDPFRPFDGVRNFVTKLSADGSELVYSTPIGGGDSDIAAAAFGSHVFIAGNVSTGTLPILNARQPRLKGGADAFLVDVSDGGALYFAHFGNGTAEGTTVVSEVLLTNSSESSPSHATVSILGDDGTALPLDLTVTGDPGTAEAQPQTSELDVTVAPLGAVRIATDGVGEVVTGSVMVTFDNPLGGVVRFNLNPNGTAGVGASQLVRGFITPVRHSAINTGVAVSNPGDEQVGLTLRLRGTDGQQVQGGLHTLALAPGEHLAQFINELFTNADLTDFEGTLTVTTGSLNALLVATALELGPQPGQFTTLPVTPIP